MFDFDGVLVDSYSCMPKIYEIIGTELGINADINEFITRAVQLEDLYDGRAIYNRLVWWPDFFNNFDMPNVDLESCVSRFWELRIALSEIRTGVTSLLNLLKSHKMTMAIVCGNDGQLGMKNHRIQRSGLADMFDDVIIIGEAIESRIQAINRLNEKHMISTKDMVIVEDKPAPIKEYQTLFPEIKTIQVDISCPLSVAWRERSSPDFSFNSVEDLLSMLKPI